ncbi:hypothetical protein DQ239_19155 [Blastococcus sp. TF02-09]|uniref:hypothetical protein n=1 Tax=Blastococcus sp. TF02-09 TaxID=2250576 RepID=UPI000DEA21B4|nr:hypothetical protein [Blastococcus sp. TF02-9]RBY74712.1 hypothetical protein DQ239_19155 [Blastococcus sp. TF02-9]
MAEDVQQVIATRGPRLRASTPGLSKLKELLSTPKLGAKPDVRQQAGDFLRSGQVEWGQASVAAFDDLLAAVRDPAATTETVAARLRVLESALAMTGRSLRSEGSLLAGVLDDAAFDIAVARRKLDGTPLPAPSRQAKLDSAGLTPDERVALCHALLQQERTPGRQAIWVVYGRARLAAAGWRVDFGPVTFYDGPAMLGLIDLVRDGTGGRREDLPEEIWADPELGDPARRDLTWPKDVERWVAVRVDLGTRRYADPVRTAWEQVEALVQVAGFHARGTAWERFSGYLFVEDGQLRGSSFPFGPPFDRRRHLHDYTDEELFRLAPRLQPHLPVTDPLLAELLQVSALVHDREESADPTTLLQDVRAIELVASRCSTAWQDLLIDNLAIDAVRQAARLDVFNAVWTMTSNSELKAHVPDLPEPNDLQQYLPGGHHRYQLRIDVALAALEPLAQAMPTHHAGGRRIRTVAAACADPAALQAWVEAAIEDYKRRVRRLKRCRDSLIHGGPISLDVAQTVQRFANRQAQAVVATALEAILQGRSIADVFAEHRHDDAAWRAEIGDASSVAEALLGQPEA